MHAALAGAPDLAALLAPCLLGAGLPGPAFCCTFCATLGAACSPKVESSSESSWLAQAWECFKVNILGGQGGPPV